MTAFRGNYTSCHRFKMLARWLTFTAFLAGSANPERAAIGQGTLTVAPTCRVKGHPEAELTLKCGDGKNAGVVQYWHTPFGDIQTPGLYSKLDPIFMHHDRSLVVPNISILHSGLYYCLLQHTGGSTLWSYELHVGPNNQATQEHSKQCGAFRFKRDVGSVEERQAEVSDGLFAGAVAASVLLTFVVGFSAGALTRTHVLRCLGAVTTRMGSPRQRRSQTNTQDHDSEVTITTLPPMYYSQAFEMGQVCDNDDSANCASMETTISSTTSSPPAKPKRSFRQKRQEEQDTTAYLEGCDYMKEEESRKEEEEEEEEVVVAVAGGNLKEKNKGCDGEAEREEERKFSGFFQIGEHGGSQTETDEDGEETDESGSREEKREWRQEEEGVEETGEHENRSKEDRERSEEKADGTEEERDEKREKEVDDSVHKRRKEDGETDICSKDDETGSKNQDDTMRNGIMEGEPLSSLSRRRRVIRLYQYNEDGQRYGHLPDPAPDVPGPAPRLKQRSLSLTRLNAIMAAASAGPLDTKETGREEREEKPHFHMEI